MGQTKFVIWASILFNFARPLKACMAEKFAQNYPFQTDEESETDRNAGDAIIRFILLDAIMLLGGLGAILFFLLLRVCTGCMYASNKSHPNL